MRKHQSIQISIPQPCYEDWSKMTQQEQGRFCNACQKCVVDFTTASDATLYHHFSSNSNICGRFHKSQLNRPIFKPTKRWASFKWFMSLGFIVFLTELIGTKAQAQEPVQKELLIEQDTSSKQTSQGNIITSQETDTTLKTVVETEIFMGGGISDGTIYYIDGVQKNGIRKRTWRGVRRFFKRR